MSIRNCIKGYIIEHNEQKLFRSALPERLIVVMFHVGPNAPNLSSSKDDM